ncbi:unnamed protein product [Tuber aestivum]|uniref:Uncharacterized protein n=1 Tax=Tuber aestivum TaxID=59557 RepID=A0A292Q2U9_9PEZI|nr:unnamed protein product [Tuber aestivum]
MWDLGVGGYPHRHVSKVGSAPLVAISLGCEAPFIAGVGEEEGVRVRCGDVVVMRGQARWEWRSSPAFAFGTCPERLQEWLKERRGWIWVKGLILL